MFATGVELPYGYILIKESDYIELLTLVSKLEERVAELESQLHKNSINSSKPPSSDGLKKVIKNNREKSANKQGAQPGHKGSTLRMVDQADKFG